MHDLENSRQQSRRLKRAHALSLQQVGERIDLSCQLGKCILCSCSTRAERVVSLAQRRNHIGECLQGTDEALNQRRRDQQNVEEQASEEQSSARGAELLLYQKKHCRGQRRQREQETKQPRAANSRPTAAWMSFRCHTFQFDDRGQPGSVPAIPRPARCFHRIDAAPYE